MKLYSSRIKSLVIAMLLIPASLFSESNDLLDYYEYSVNQAIPVEAKKILLGDIDLIDKKVNDFSLALLDNDDLRILRNTVYARHGHIFKAEDLTRYFSNFSWYEPTKTITDADLSDNERNLIQRIQIFESRDENSTPVKLNNTKTGCWQNTPIMASGLSDRFVFHDDNKLDFLYSQMRNLPIISEINGTYEIKGNVLIYYVSSIKFTTGSTNYENIDKSIFYWWGDDSITNTVTFEKPIVYKFPVTQITDKQIRPDYNKKMLSIGSQDYYKYSSNVKDKY